MSENVCSGASGIYCYLTDKTLSEGSVNCVVEYSLFKNNYAVNDKCLHFRYKTHEMRFSNIINNSQGNEGSTGTIYIGNNANLTISECSIVNNTATYVFYANSGSTINCDEKCYIDKTTKVGGGSVDFASPSSNAYEHVLPFYDVCYYVKTKKLPTLQKCNNLLFSQICLVSVLIAVVVTDVDNSTSSS